MAIKLLNTWKSFVFHTVITDPKVKFYYGVSLYYCNSMKQKQAEKINGMY